MQQSISWLQQIFQIALNNYFHQESEYRPIENVPLPDMEWLDALVPEHPPTFSERIVLLLALMPHISPQTLDLFFLQNKELDRPYTEFGGWKGTSHNGFLPTGETAAFILAANQPERRQEVIRLFDKEHWFHQNNLLRLEGQGEGEPFLSGQLRISDEWLAKLTRGGDYQPDYNASFPAKRITTPLDWSDLVLPYNLREELDDIAAWLQHHVEIRSQWKLDRIIKAGYRCLFYGPPGTGKTLTATLLGKQNELEVYRVDLSMIVSKYIGETEKNLAKIFDRAEHQRWILFFDEADALFGQRTETNNSNDRHANQEVAYLLQRIEDHPGMVILATNLKENIDEAFFRRFQSVLYFPMPDQALRRQLWLRMLPSEWLPEHPDELLREASGYKLSGGSMVNIVQTCALKLYNQSMPTLDLDLLKQAIAREQAKEGRIIAHP